MAGVRSMAFILGSTRTDSTAQPVVGQASPTNAARRKAMAKDTIRTASVLSSGPTGQANWYRSGSLRASQSLDGPLLVRMTQLLSLPRAWRQFAAGLRRSKPDAT